MRRKLDPDNSWMDLVYIYMLGAVGGTLFTVLIYILRGGRIVWMR